MEEDADNRLNPMTLIIVLSVVVVGIVVAIFAVLYIIGRNTSDASQGVLVPYSIATRLVPTTTVVAEILPEQLGNFKRGPITGSIQNYKASYTNGTDKIDLAGSQGVSLRAAQASVANIAQLGNSSSPIQHQLYRDPSFAYILGSGTGPVRLAWSHDRWFFDVKADSQAALDRFMGVFKY
jgi:hypothetical protein